MYVLVRYSGLRRAPRPAASGWKRHTPPHESVKQGNREGDVAMTGTVDHAFGDEDGARGRDRCDVAAQSVRDIAGSIRAAAQTGPFIAIRDKLAINDKRTQVRCPPDRNRFRRRLFPKLP